jgi:hypothetical protein
VGGADRTAAVATSLDAGTWGRGPASRELPRGGVSWLGWGLVALGCGIALSSVLGPLVLGVLVYRTSATSLQQIVGADAAGLVVSAPLSIALGFLVLRGRRRVLLLAPAPAVFAAYTYAQLAVGNEYLDRPGNVERFFPLLLGVFVLAMAVAVGAWSETSRDTLPDTTARGDRVAGATLVAIAAFVLVGLHLPTYLDAVSGHPTTVGYLTSPTAFWLVKFMDLGILVPAALAVGVGMLRRRPWARRPMLAIVGGYALLGVSVAAMAVVMSLRGDPDASVATLVGSVAAAVILVGLAGYLYAATLALPDAAGPGSG